MVSEDSIRGLAAKVILRFGFSPPVDLDELARKAGFAVRYVEFPQTIRNCGGAIKLSDDARAVSVCVNATDPGLAKAKDFRAFLALKAQSFKQG